MNEITFKDEPSIGGVYSSFSKAELDMIMRDALQYDPEGKSAVVKGVTEELELRRGQDKQKEQAKLKVTALNVVKDETKGSIQPPLVVAVKKVNTSKQTRAKRTT